MKTANSHIQRALVACAIMLLCATAIRADTYVDAQLRITPQPRRDLDVYVWPDRGEGGVYYPGDQIYVNVQPSKDCFLVLYNIDTRGRLNILFPTDPWQDNFVRGGDIIEFPRHYDGVDWNIEGPHGTEYIQVIASEVPMDLPEWPVYQDHVNMSSDYHCDPALGDFYAGSNRSAYIDVVNRNIGGRYYDWCATDVATIYVQPRPSYRPAHVYDPWPDVFFGEIYIGFPIGARIYVDGIFIGNAPCRIPRSYGRRVITCYDGPRLIRRQVCHVYAKHEYGRFKTHYPKYHYKSGRGDWSEHWDYDRDDDRGKYRVSEKSKRAGQDGSWYDYDGLSRDKRANRSDVHIKKQSGGGVIGRSGKPPSADVRGQRGSSTVETNRDASAKREAARGGVTQSDRGDVIRPSTKGERGKIQVSGQSAEVKKGEQSSKRSEGVISAKRSGNESVSIKRESSTQRVEKTSKRRGGQESTAQAQKTDCESQAQKSTRSKSTRGKGSRGGN